MPRESLTVLSLGAGVQSSVLALKLSEGDPALAALGYTTPDVAIFADTGWEPGYVYEHLEWLRARVSFEIVTVKESDLREDTEKAQGPQGEHFVSIPLYVDTPTGPGILKRQCTSAYKIKPIHREVRRQMGFKARQRIPIGAVKMMMGISLDEVQRMNPSRVRWIETVWPLVDARLTRADCLHWFAHKYPDHKLPRSACIVCPFHSDSTWRDMKEREPEAFAEAVAFDKRLRTPESPLRKALLTTQVGYLHRSHKPLEEALLKPDRLFDSNFDEECGGHCGI